MNDNCLMTMTWQYRDMRAEYCYVCRTLMPNVDRDGFPQVSTENLQSKVLRKSHVLAGFDSQDSSFVVILLVLLASFQQYNKGLIVKNGYINMYENDVNFWSPQIR